MESPSKIRSTCGIFRDSSRFCWKWVSQLMDGDGMTAELPPGGGRGAGQVTLPPPMGGSGVAVAALVAEAVSGAGGGGGGGSVAGGKNWSMVGWIASAQIW